MALRIQLKRLLLTGALAGAVAVPTALGLSANQGAVVAECAPGTAVSMYSHGCVPILKPGPGALTQLQLSQPGGGYLGPAIPKSVNAPSQLLLTACNGGGQSNCLMQSLYGR